MIVTTKMKLDLIARNSVTPSVEVVQDDKYSRDLAISLYAGGVAWLPPEGTSFVVGYKKPDGTKGVYNTMPDGTAAFSVSSNVVTVKLAPQICTCPGLVAMVLRMTSGDREISIFPISVKVWARPGVDAESEDYNNVSGLLSASGWAPNKYLITDASGNVVTGEAPAGGGGLSEEWAEQIRANTEAIDASPVAVDAQGYTDIAGLRQPTLCRFVRTEGNVEMHIPLQGGLAYTGNIALDENGFPTKCTGGGVEIPMEFEGFDDLLTTVWEGGSY